MSTLLAYKCPCCGGAIRFDSGIQRLKCPYCDTEFEPEAMKAHDEALQAEQPDEMAWTSAASEWEEGEEDTLCSYVCDSCGGEIIAEQTTTATSCPYCGNPVIMKGRLSGSLKPDFVIPFKLDKEAAKQGLRAHLKGKRLLPKVFKDENHIDEIKGVYVPFWLFGADADADIQYHATKVRMWSDANYNYTKTSHYSVCRAGRLGFDQVPVDGSQKMDDALMESLEPFDFREAVDFKTAYLAGYLADKYDVTAEESQERANRRIKQTTSDCFLTTVQGYSSVTTERCTIRLENGLARYALFPVWILNTTWKGKTYTFAMNGQSGKFVGDLPLDWKAWWRWFLGVSAAVSAVVFGLLALVMM
ncbi:MAG: hypothetical protein IJP27_07160 [Clostridia bacterium]|nr:hypothetical protein [Clostridia bacterium]